MISWPDVLPAPTRDYSLSVDHGLVRTQMESGRTRQERAFLDSENEASVVWLFTDAQYQLFDSWVYHALNGGADWFECPIVSGGGVTTHQVRIQGGTYKPQLQPGMAWRVSAVIDIESTNRADNDYVEFYVSVSGEGETATSAITQLDELVNGDLRDWLST